MTFMVPPAYSRSPADRRSSGDPIADL